MKFIYSSIISSLLESKSSKQNIRLLLRFLLLLGVMVTSYSVVFHFLMAAEGREYSWITGFYWTLVVMTTLGLGDITFAGDLGKAFSILVLLSGVVFLLVLLPFTFIKFFFAPWMAAESRRRTPNELGADTRDHVIITSYDAITAALIEKLSFAIYSGISLFSLARYVHSRRPGISIKARAKAIPVCSSYWRSLSGVRCMIWSS